MRKWYAPYGTTLYDTIKYVPIGLMTLALITTLAFNQACLPTGQAEEPTLTALEPAPPAQRVSLQFKDADLRQALQLIAEECSFNIAFGKEIEGTVTASFNEVTPQEILNTILKINDCESFTENNILIIRKKGKLPTLITRTFYLEHVDASCMKETLKKLISPEGDILTFIRRRGVGNEQLKERSQVMIITETPSKIEEIKRLIRELDTPLAQVMIEARVVTFNLNQMQDAGIKWSLPVEKSSVLTVTQTAPASTTTVALTKTNLPLASKTQTPDDKFFPYTLEDDFKFGMIPAEKFSQLLKLFQSRSSSVNLLARPMVTTLDNQETEIFIGDTVPIPVYASTEQSPCKISHYTDERFGITLKITPHIIRNEEVVMEVSPEIKEIKNWMSGPTGKKDKPVISIRRAGSQFRIKDNATIIIGGLMLTDEKTRESRVPLLGSIPLLGAIFRSKTVVHEKIDLVIFITPRILTKDRLKD